MPTMKSSQVRSPKLKSSQFQIPHSNRGNFDNPHKNQVSFDPNNEIKSLSIPILSSIQFRYPDRKSSWFLFRYKTKSFSTPTQKVNSDPNSEPRLISISHTDIKSCLTTHAKTRWISMSTHSQVIFTPHVKRLSQFRPATQNRSQSIPAPENKTVSACTLEPSQYWSSTKIK